MASNKATKVWEVMYCQKRQRHAWLNLWMSLHSNLLLLTRARACLGDELPSTFGVMLSVTCSSIHEQSLRQWASSLEDHCATPHSVWYMKGLGSNEEHFHGIVPVPRTMDATLCHVTGVTELDTLQIGKTTEPSINFNTLTSLLTFYDTSCFSLFFWAM